MQVVGPGCSHRPLERNLPALGIDPLPAFLRFPASGSWEQKVRKQKVCQLGHRQVSRCLGTPPCSGPWKLLHACWVVRVFLFSKEEDCQGAS